MNPDRNRGPPAGIDPNAVYVEAAPVHGHPNPPYQQPGYYPGYPAQGYAQPPQGYGQVPPPGYAQPPPGYSQAPPPGYAQPPPGPYGQPPPGYAQPQAYAQPVYVEAVPAQPAYGAPGQPPVVQGFAHDGPDYGVCRGCGRRFLRHPGVSSASAQYYRCDICAQPSVGDFCVIC